MNIRLIISLILVFAISKKSFCMFDNTEDRNYSRQELEAQKKEMRETLDQVVRSVTREPMTRREQPHQILQEQLEIVHNVANATSKTDPQMARRARNLISIINSKLKYNMNVDDKYPAVTKRAQKS